MGKGLRSIQFIVGKPNQTLFGGLVLFQQFCKKLDLQNRLTSILRRCHVWRNSPFKPSDLLLALIYLTVAGIGRLSNARVLAYNGSLPKLLGLTRFPKPKVFRNLLKSLSPKAVTALSVLQDQLRQESFHLKPRTSLILDFDSTVLPLFGWQIEGAKIGYNPRKPRRPSYHPLLCFETHTQDIWHASLRPGDWNPVTGLQPFTREALDKVPKGIYRIRVRADAGFYDGDFIRLLDDKNIQFVVVAKMTRPIQEKLEALRYHRFQGHWQVAEFRYQPMRWLKPYRFIVVRRPKPENPLERAQLTLFTLKHYVYHVFVTNLALEPDSVWRFYKGRAQAELFIRQLKWDYPIGKIPTNNFRANQAYFHLVLLAFSLTCYFKRMVLPKYFQKATLNKLRTDLFLLPAQLLRIHNRNVLKIPGDYAYQEALHSTLSRIHKLRWPKI